ncbi:MAG: hypothetical protein KKA73_00550 [Chloroflexi bacterium]|nr:hypothetical protein [Chloroflexota bacterium]MBU1746151.1 hypothetical protein [Chloroflexota bacterium]
MTQTTRILIVVVIVVVIALALASLGIWQLLQPAPPASTPAEGMIHIYVDGAFRANTSPAEIAGLPQGAFQDAEEGKTQEGAWLKDLIARHVDVGNLSPVSEIRVQGAHRQTGEARTAAVTWVEAQDEGNHVILDVSGDGLAVKLVSTLPRLDTRDEWVQAVSRIDVVTRP